MPNWHPRARAILSMVVYSGAVLFQGFGFSSEKEHAMKNQTRIEGRWKLADDRAVVLCSKHLKVSYYSAKTGETVEEPAGVLTPREYWWLELQETGKPPRRLWATERPPVLPNWKRFDDIILQKRDDRTLALAYTDRPEVFWLFDIPLEPDSNRELPSSPRRSYAASRFVERTRIDLDKLGPNTGKGEIESEDPAFVNIEKLLKEEIGDEVHRHFIGESVSLDRVEWTGDRWEVDVSVGTMSATIWRDEASNSWSVNRIEGYGDPEEED